MKISGTAYKATATGGNISPVKGLNITVPTGATKRDKSPGRHLRLVR